MRRVSSCFAIVLAAAMLVIAGSADAAGNEFSEATPAIVEVEVGLTPGKPLDRFDPKEPAESILVCTQTGRQWIEVRVNVPRAGVSEPLAEKADLTEVEWHRIMKLVEQVDPSTWPQAAAHAEADAATSRLGVQGTSPFRREWSGSPIDRPGMPALTGAMLDLVAAKLPNRLAYFHVAGGPAGLGAIGRIMVGVTPAGTDRRGDPRQPAESITLVIRPDGQHLELRRNRVELLDEVVGVPISKKELEAVLALIVRNALLEWKPEGGKPDPRYGSRVLVLDPLVKQSWDRPVDNARAVDGLFIELARLAEAGRPRFFETLTPPKR